MARLLHDGRRGRGSSHRARVRGDDAAPRGDHAGSRSPASGAIDPRRIDGGLHPLRARADGRSEQPGGCRRADRRAPVVVEFILYSSIRSAANSADRMVLLRALGSFACLVLEQAGAVVLFFGSAWGLYAVGLGMMSSFIFMVTGAWLLLVGIGSKETAAVRSG